MNHSYPDRPFFAIIGHPIGHSLSPLMHTTAMRELRIDSAFIAVDIAPSRLEEGVKELISRGCKGFNVTIPHKETIRALLDEEDAEARAVGAVNTVVVKDGRLYGYNTDIAGVRATLDSLRHTFTGKRAVVLGAGGGARAVLHVLVNDYATEHITIASRTLKRAEGLAASLLGKGSTLLVLPIEQRRLLDAVNEATLIVNSTPVGMSPNTEASPLPTDAPLHAGQIVFDLIPRPLQTTLLRLASERGATTVGGLEMLLHQGAKAFELFTGTLMPLNLVKRVLQAHLAPEP
jgi:shikimate dehydrogenase